MKPKHNVKYDNTMALGMIIAYFAGMIVMALLLHVIQLQGNTSQAYKEQCPSPDASIEEMQYYMNTGSGDDC